MKGRGSILYIPSIEIVANLVLCLLDGKRERMYGHACCKTSLGRGDQETPMDDILRKLFVAARGPLN